MGAALLLVASLFTLDPVGSVDLQAEVRSGTRFRMLDQDPRPNEPIPVDASRRVAELGVAPRLALANDARLRLYLAYTPSVNVPFEAAPPGTNQGSAPSPLDRTSFLNNAELRAERDWGFWSMRAGASATLGRLDPLAGGPPAVAVTTTGRIPYQAWSLNAGVTAIPWQRGTLTVDGHLSQGGGDGSLAERVLPVQQELRIASALDHLLTRRDTFGATLTFVGARLDRVDPAVPAGGERIDAATLQGGPHWLRVLSRQFSLRLAGGAAAAYEVSSANQWSRIGPWGLAALAYQPGGLRPSLTLSVGLEPTIDRLTGSLSYRGLVEARSEWVPTRDWRLEASANAGVLEPWLGFDGQVATSTWIGGGSVYAGRELWRNVLIGASVAGIWQDSGRQDLSSFREVVAALELRAILQGPAADTTRQPGGAGAPAGGRR
ncbi:hypothetical protein [Vulgatibacter incomptus]|uniref:Uncharacterized protein n=1 Tax=Vulgatibacter incomptus TaxID=1391653 RepID=A0A0K1P9Q5_9BACT|nr:hypothetical protein [Vulgatibacter incomptus]AKU89844.1 hypothetical protein AKJ08_0231 [Vulgatibacter incomptus]